MRKNKGITLIALVITIIVLLILAAVSIAMLIGENGILNQAKKSQIVTEKAEAEDRIKLIINEWQIEKNTSNKSLEDYLNKKVPNELDKVTKNENGSFTVEVKGYQGTISDKGRLEGEITKISGKELEGDNFYFEAEETSSEVEMVNYKTKVEITVKNNNGTKYNKEAINYEISVEDNEKFTMEEGEKITKTIEGNNIVNDKVIVNLKTNNTANFKENVIIRVKAIEPYEKEIRIPIAISAKTKRYEISTMISESLTTGPLTAENIHAADAPETDSNFYIDGDNGIYINDIFPNKAYWIGYDFLMPDGYSTSLDLNHIYFAGIDVKILSQQVENFVFSFADANHVNGIWGNVIFAKGGVISDKYNYISLYTKPQMGQEISANGQIYEADYMDTLQFGTSTKGIVTMYMKNLVMTDITQIFGEGNEPPEEWCNENIKYGTTSVEWFAME